MVSVLALLCCLQGIRLTAGWIDLVAHEGIIEEASCRPEGRFDVLRVSLRDGDARREFIAWSRSCWRYGDPATWPGHEAWLVVEPEDPDLLGIEVGGVTILDPAGEVRQGGIILIVLGVFLGAAAFATWRMRS